jgi:hypothetical protein
LRHEQASFAVEGHAVRSARVFEEGRHLVVLVDPDRPVGGGFREDHAAVGQGDGPFTPVETILDDVNLGATRDDARNCGSNGVSRRRQRCGGRGLTERHDRREMHERRRDEYHL